MFVVVVVLGWFIIQIPWFLSESYWLLFSFLFLFIIYQTSTTNKQESSSLHSYIFILFSYVYTLKYHKIYLFDFPFILYIYFWIYIHIQITYANKFNIISNVISFFILANNKKILYTLLKIKWSRKIYKEKTPNMKDNLFILLVFNVGLRARFKD